MMKGIILFLISFNLFAGYNRKDWKHWIDSDHDCQDTRAEILIERSLAPVAYKNSKGCSVFSGKWDDFYFNEKLTIASDIDIDHVVPLSHAHNHGAESWSKELKKSFANDKENLVITFKKYNRQKGDSDIAQWLPVDRGYACRYVKKWFQIKEKYRLRIDADEIETRRLLSCS